MKICPCGTNLRFLDCCGKYLLKKEHAPTPEALMRSRYSAFVEGNLEYIKQTMRPPASLQFNKKVSKRDKVNWLGLLVIKSSIDPNDPAIGFVEFKASYKKNNTEHCIHENSIFHCLNDRWFYVDGDQY